METIHEGYPAVVLRSPEAEGLEATYAPSVGMVGCSLKHDGAELLAQRGGLTAYAESGSTFGIPLLHPWANRLAGFHYAAVGRAVELDRRSRLLHLDPNGLPMHGLLAASPDWQVTASSDARLSAALDFGAHAELLEAFPYPHAIELDVGIAGTTLSVRTTIRATGAIPVPLAFGYHPYLRLPDVPRADWRIEAPVRTHLLLDDEMIPTGITEAAGDLDGPLGQRGFDDAYADLADPPTFVLEGGGRRIELRFGEGYRFAQIYSPPDQDLICFEPMAAPTNALVSGHGLRFAEPGSSFSAEFQIAVTSV